MGYVVNGSGISKGNTGNGVTTDCPVSTLAQENDVAVCVFKRINGTTASAPAGWETISLNDGGTYIFYKNQGATPDTKIQIPSDSTTGAASTFVMRGLNVSTSTSAYQAASYTSTLNSSAHPITGPSVTPASINSSIIMGAGEGSGQPMIPEHGAKYITGMITSQMNQIIIEDFQPTATATTGYTWRRNHTSITGIDLVYAFVMVDSGAGVTKAYVDWATNPIVTPIHMMGYRGESGISSLDTATFDLTSAIPNINDANGDPVSTVYDTMQNTSDVLQRGTSSVKINSTSAAASIGATVLNSVPTLTGKHICFSPKFRLATGLADYTEVGAYFILSDQTNSRIWVYGGKDTNPKIEEGVYPVIIDPNEASLKWQDIGTVTLANCKTIGIGFNKPSSNNEDLYMTPVVLLEPLTLEDAGGISGSMLDIEQYTVLNRLNTWSRQGGQTEAQFMGFQSVRIKCNWNGDKQSVAFPDSYDPDAGRVQAMILDQSIEFLFDVPDGKTVSDRNKVVYGGSGFHKYGFAATTSTHATTTYAVDGAAWVSVTPYLNAINGSLNGLLIADSKEAVFTTLADCSGGVTFSGCVDAQQITISGATQAALQLELDKLDNCSFTTASGVSIRVEFTGTGDVTLAATGMTFSGNTTDVHYDSTNASTLTITDDGSGILEANCTVSGAAVDVLVTAPVVALTIDPDINITGSIRYFDGTPDDQTVTGSGTGDTLVYTYPDTDPIDIEVVEQFYVPVNQQNITPSNSTRDITMDFDEAYNSGHALTRTIEYDYTRTATAVGTLTINSDQNALDVRSALADLIRTTTAYYNTKLLLEAIPGLVRIDQLGGLTVTSMATWKGAGSEAFDAADATNPVAKYFAIQTVGGITGATTHYRQTSSGDSTSVTLTSNVVNEAFQYWSDPNHDASTADGYNKSTYMMVKSFLAGSRQGRVDVLANAGIAALKSTLYVVPLANTDHDYTGVDPVISGITLIAGGTFGGKVFAYEIVDAGTNSGVDIANHFNMQAAANPNTVIPGGTGLRYFEMPDMVIYNATSVETARGYREGATPALVGFYASRGGSIHPSFTRFQADDGTYYNAPQSATATINNITTTTRVQLYDTAGAVELYNGVPGATSYEFSETYTVDRTIRVRLTDVVTTTAKKMIEAVVGSISTSSYNISYNASQEADTTYNTNAIDGSTVTGITIDDTLDLVNINIAGGSVTWPNIYAYEVYWLHTATGIQDDFAFINAPDTANYILTSFQIKNTSSPTVPLVISSGYGRDSVTGSSVDLVDTTGGTLIFAPDHVVPYSTGSGLTAGQDAALTAVKAKTDSLAFTVAGQVDANVQYFNDVEIQGTGAAGDLWRG